MVTIGTFDGVHLGHQALIQQARQEAEARKLPVIAYTFDPHPARFFSTSGPLTLMPLDRRVDALLAIGADQVVVEPFNATLAEVPAEQWVQRYVVDRLTPKHVVVGFNFFYGKARGGSPQTLRNQGERVGFTVDVVQAVMVGDKVVSSTEVRRALSEGKIHEAEALLGRPYSVVGKVVPGEKIGRKMGYPTANVAPEHEQMPAAGVYAGWLNILDGEEHGGRWPIVINVGFRPTFDGKSLTVEAHVLNTHVDLYGARVSIEFSSWLRAERKFDGPEALRTQIEADATLARKELGQS